MNILLNLKDKLSRPASPRLEPLKLSAYGKLPLYKDYIQLACGEGPAAGFKQWVDGAFGVTFEEFGGKNVALEWPSRVLWRLADRRRVAAAVVWPSADEGGLRRFPFCFFTILDPVVLEGGDFQAGWRLLEFVWARLEERFEQAKGLNSIEGFYEAFKDATITPELPAGAPSSVPGCEALMRSLAPDQPVLFAVRLTAMLTDLIADCRDLTDDGAGLGVRAPLGRGLDVGIQVEAWVQVFQRNLKACYPWPAMIVPGGPARDEAALCLLWREGRPHDSILFAPDTGDYEFIEDIAAQAREVLREGAAANSPGAFDLSMSLDEWISLVGGAR